MDVELLEYNFVITSGISANPQLIYDYNKFKDRECSLIIFEFQGNSSSKIFFNLEGGRWVSKILYICVTL